MNKAVAEIKTTEKYFNPTIFTLECHVQIVVSCSLHFFAKYFEQNLIIRALIISNGMFSVWIKLNLLELFSFLILIFAKVQLENNRSATFAGEFRRVTAIINPVTIAQFFETTCTSIFKCLFAAGSTKSGLFGPVSTYFDIIKTNG